MTTTTAVLAGQFDVCSHFRNRSISQLARICSGVICCDKKEYHIILWVHQLHWASRCEVRISDCLEGIEPCKRKRKGHWFQRMLVASWKESKERIRKECDLLSLSHFLGTTKMYPGTTDCDRMSATYSYVDNGMRMSRIIHVLCVSR
jgi:hypothetical protein